MSIKIQNLSKKFKDLSIFNNLNLEIPQGQILAIMGESGRGKTTLLNLISGIDTDFEGQILVLDKDIKHWNKQELWSKQVAFIFQDFNLLPELTVLENVLLPLQIQGQTQKIGKETATQKAIETLRYLGIGEKVDSKIDKISGGQIQRVAIARALVSGAKIIFADEPTGNLDDKNTLEVLELFRQIRADYGTTVIIVTHNKLVGNACDKILQL